MAEALGKVRPICEILEEIIQCPVCLEISSPRVMYQCTIGHHICSFCKNKLEVCPSCRTPFSTTRNFACEDLIDKFENIKDRINQATKERKKKVESVSVSTQTERPHKTAAAARCTQTDKNPPEPTVKDTCSTPPVGKGLYYCCIGSCTIKDVHAKLLWHLKANHKQHFFEFPWPENDMFTKKLIIDNTLPQDYDYAFLIAKMGLFFVHFSIQYTGDFRAYVQLVNSVKASNGFKYVLSLDSATSSTKHHGQVYSCRDQMQTGNIFCMSEQDMLRITNGKPFNCSITIKRETKTPQPVKIADPLNSTELHELLAKLR